MYGPDRIYNVRVCVQGNTRRVRTQPCEEEAMWKTSCVMTFVSFFFLEPPNWDFGVEIGAEVPETPKCTVAHWGPLAWCLEKGSGQAVPPVPGESICQLRTLQKRPFKKGLGQNHISPVLSAQLHPCPAPGSLSSEDLTQFLPSALPLEVTSEKLAVARAHLLRLTWLAPISVACLPSSLSRPHHPCSVFRAAP